MQEIKIPFEFTRGRYLRDDINATPTITVVICLLHVFVYRNNVSRISMKDFADFYESPLTLKKSYVRAKLLKELVINFSYLADNGYITLDKDKITDYDVDDMMMVTLNDKLLNPEKYVTLTFEELEKFYTAERLIRNEAIIVYVYMKSYIEQNHQNGRPRVCCRDHGSIRDDLYINKNKMTACNKFLTQEAGLIKFYRTGYISSNIYTLNDGTSEMEYESYIRYLRKRERFY